MQTAFEVIANAVRAAKAGGVATRSDDAATYHCGAVFIKHMPLLQRGDSVVQHSHKHPHVTLIASGCAMMSVDGRPDSIHKAPAFIEIAAGEHHAFVAVEDNTHAYCIHDTTGLGYESDDDFGEPFK